MCQMSTPPTGGLSGGAKLMKLQLKYNAQRHTLSDVDPAMRFNEFQLLVQTRTTLSVSKQSLLVGFPPKELVVTDPATQTLSALNIRTGDLITVKVREDDESVAAALAAAAPGSDADVKAGGGGVLQGKGGWEWPPTINKNGHMIRKEMPRDNSCLFHAISYLCQPNGGSSDSKTSNRAMRDLIATIVAHDPATYSTAFLGSSNQTYQNTILNPDSWGGAIELSIFSRHFQTEIFAYDTHHLREDVFGGDQNYKRRVFLLYSGDHYDAMAYAPSSGSGSGSGVETRVFSTKDEYSVTRAQQFVESIHLELVKNGQATKQSGFKKGAAVKPAARSGGQTASGATKWSCPVCTYAENPLNKDECLLCQAKRDGGAPSPAVAALNSAAAAAAANPKPKPKPAGAGSSNSGSGSGPVFDGSGREVWVCASCTYKNIKSSGTTVCAMCNEPAPAQAQSAPEALIEPEPLFNPFSFFAAAAAAQPRTAASTARAPVTPQSQPLSGTVAQHPTSTPTVGTIASPLRTPAPLQPPPGDKKAAALLADAKRSAETKQLQQQQQQQQSGSNAGGTVPAAASPAPSASASARSNPPASNAGGSGIVIGAETGAETGSSNGGGGGGGGGDGSTWECKVCTVVNDISSVTCSACELPNPALQSSIYGQTPTSATQQQMGGGGGGGGGGGAASSRPAWRPPPRPTASAAAAAASSDSARPAVRPIHTEQPSFLSRALNPERSWQCERCGSAQLPTIIQCSACGQPNINALRQAGGDGGGCAIM